jgi:phospholipid/cholesterol/gamma-HCH transport system substrate-binding protein
VRGLNEGGEVHFNGIKVGEVTKIALDKTNPRNVIARVRVTEDVPIRVDSYATLEPQGITGLNYIQISAGTPTKPLLQDVACKNVGIGRECIPILHSQRSAISDLLEGGGTVLTAPSRRCTGQPGALRREHQDLLGGLSDAQAVTAELRERKASIADAQSALAADRRGGREHRRAVGPPTSWWTATASGWSRTLADAADEAKAAAKDAAR